MMRNLLFHTLAELFSIFIVFSIFLITWSSRRLLNSTYFLFIGIAYFFVGSVDVLHTLAYKGMNILRAGTANISAQLWIAARMMQSISLLIAPLFAGRRLRYNLTMIAYFLVSSMALLSIFYWKIFPVCFEEVSGVTSFKTASEYVISVVLAAAVVLLLLKRRQFDADVVKLLVSSILLAMGAEAAFILYPEEYGGTNFIGHLFKVVSFYLVYRAVIVTGLLRPHEILFRNLKQNEADLNELNRELETTVAERTMSLMALSVADRVRNPAAIIGSISRRIVEKEKVPDKLQQALRSIIGEAAHLESVVKDFESLLKLRQSSYNFESINEIVRMALPTLEREAVEKGIAFSTNLSKSPLKINVQRNLLRAALFHVIKNAIDATPKGGRITVATSHEDDHIAVTVTDTGSGIPQEDIKKVFDLFFSTKRYRFGLGLSLVKQIMAEHLGDVTLESELGKGTTVRLIFPARWLIPLTFRGTAP